MSNDDIESPHYDGGAQVSESVVSDLDRRRSIDAKLDILFAGLTAEDGEFDDDYEEDDESDEFDEYGDAIGADDEEELTPEEEEFFQRTIGASFAKRRSEAASIPSVPRPVAKELPPTVHSGERLQKVMARVGVGSRRACELLIEAGRVRVNGERAVLGRRVDSEADLITVDGAPIGSKSGLVYYLLNKPIGVVSAASDPHGRPVVVDLVPEEPRVYPVGRLDADTSGLILLTNDGELTHRVMHPSFGVEKEYLAEVDGRPTPAVLRALREGVELEDGWTAPAKVSSVSPNSLRITIHEGKNRQVRRMLDSVGHPVVRLVRIRIDSITDSSLPPGRWRPVSERELAALRRTVRTTRAMRRHGLESDPGDDDLNPN